MFLLLPPYFLAGATTKKNKPLIAARIAEEKEKDRLKDLRRDTRRRQWALALADILARRNGLPIKGVELVFKLDDDKRRYLAQQVKKELGLSENLDGAALRHKVEDILRRWPAGIGSSPRTFLSSSGGPGPGPRRAGFRLHAHRLSDPLYRRARLVRRTSGLAGVIT
ncbi:membrane protein [Salmonella enterica subsp. enterica]|uniref:Membrane protein n=1 Tax=Salmonella enterica I TaxID=59201 RepID=A0A447U0B4_SALET|nr:membrane protein [Salmonella enterica subsp. enterica]